MYLSCLWSSRDNQAGSDREQADGEGVRGRGKGEGDPTQGPEVRELCEPLKSTRVARHSDLICIYGM